MNEYNLFDINPEYSRMINNYYATPKIHIPKPRILNEDTAKAKGLSLYTFGVNQYGKTNEVYAKNEKEAIKRARKRGFDINLLKISD